MVTTDTSLTIDDGRRRGSEFSSLVATFNEDFLFDLVEVLADTQEAVLNELNEVYDSSKQHDASQDHVLYLFFFLKWGWKVSMEGVNGRCQWKASEQMEIIAEFFVLSFFYLSFFCLLFFRLLFFCPLPLFL
ncbi:hypothetical protein LINPERPRIM_LOCUS6719 [Linum perenne]